LYVPTYLPDCGYISGAAFFFLFWLLGLEPSPPPSSFLLLLLTTTFYLFIWPYHPCYLFVSLFDFSIVRSEKL
jgi:hypothetical protein